VQQKVEMGTWQDRSMC